MEPVLEQVVEFAKQPGWCCRASESNCVQGFVVCESGRWAWLAWTNEAGDCFTFHTFAPVHIPRGRRQPAAEYLTRANYGLIGGAFELDFADGEVRHTTSFPIAVGTRLPKDVVRNVICAGLARVEQYVPGLLSVVWRCSSPAREVRRAERAARSQRLAISERKNSPPSVN